MNLSVAYFKDKNGINTKTLSKHIIQAIIITIMTTVLQ